MSVIDNIFNEAQGPSTATNATKVELMAPVGVVPAVELNSVKVEESYFPPQPSTDHNLSSAVGSEFVKSPDVESRGLMASKAFNKDNPTTERVTDPIREPQPISNGTEPNATETLPDSISHNTFPHNKQSILNPPLPVTATEASGFKMKHNKSATLNAKPSDKFDQDTPPNTTPTIDNAELPVVDGATPEHSTPSQPTQKPKKRASLLRSSASDLRRFFKSLSIRGKPSDAAEPKP